MTFLLILTCVASCVALALSVYSTVRGYQLDRRCDGIEHDVERHDDPNYVADLVATGILRSAARSNRLKHHFAAASK
jgi:hypothetical protein